MFRTASIAALSLSLLAGCVQETTEVNNKTKLMLTVALSFWAGTAAAYVGPGAGITVLGALWGLIPRRHLEA